MGFAAWGGWKQPARQTDRHAGSREARGGRGGSPGAWLCPTRRLCSVSHVSPADTPMLPFISYDKGLCAQKALWPRLRGRAGLGLPLAPVWGRRFPHGDPRAGLGAVHKPRSWAEPRGCGCSSWIHAVALPGTCYHSRGCQPKPCCFQHPSAGGTAPNDGEEEFPGIPTRCSCLALHNGRCGVLDPACCRGETVLGRARCALTEAG